MTALDQLYDKLSAEYEALIGSLQNSAPDEIIERAYEKVCKENILMCFEAADYFNENEIGVLLSLEAPLDGLYRSWLDTDASCMDSLRDSISEFAEQEIKRRDGTKDAVSESEETYK